MSEPDPRGLRSLPPLLLLSLVVVLVAFGASRGLWLANLHNGLLALALTVVGAYVLHQRPGHREGRLLLAAGVVEGVMFMGRQVGHAPFYEASDWYGWFGVWPLALALALTTLAVICFPDGRLPSRGWLPVAGLVVLLAVTCAALSATWPVDYAAAGVQQPHPWHADTPAAVTTTWGALAHPTYAAFQLLWVVALVARWRSSDGLVRRQVAALIVAAALSVVTLVVGLVIGGTPVPGLITTALVPVTAGWAIVHGQNVRAYSALSWLSRSGPADLPSELARAAAEALGAPGAQLWLGPPEDLHVVGLWPESEEPVAASDLASLRAGPGRHAWPVTSGGAVVGVLSIDRARNDRLSLAEARLVDDLAAQAALVIDHLNLSDVIAQQRRAGHLDGLSARERDVLELMSRGLSNAAICEELHLSIKTVEPVVGTFFQKLGLHADAASNRRVLAVLAYVRS